MYTSYPLPITCQTNLNKSNFIILKGQQNNTHRLYKQSTNLRNYKLYVLCYGQQQQQQPIYIIRSWLSKLYKQVREGTGNLACLRECVRMCVCVCVCVYACACVLLTSKSSAFSCVFMLQSDIHITAYTSILFQENGKAGLFSSLTVLGSDWSEERSPFFPLASSHDPAGAG